MLQTVLAALILLAAVPLGYLLAYLTKDELKAGRKWFKLLAITSLTLIIIILFLNSINKVLRLASILTLLFIIITCLISIKAGDKTIKSKKIK